jgi:hypothetical protein
MDLKAPPDGDRMLIGNGGRAEMMRGGKEGLCVEQQQGRKRKRKEKN